MAANTLPKAITKEVLLNAIQNKLMSCAKMFWDPNVTAQQMYEDLTCSVFSGSLSDDFPDAVKAEQDSVIKYQYKDGSCFFILDDIIVEVQDLRGMRVSARIGEESYSDICVLTISYINSDNILMSHVVPYSWLYGSTSEYFDEGMPVHKEFIDAAHEYISTHKLTKEMQEVHND